MKNQKPDIVMETLADYIWEARKTYNDNEIPKIIVERMIGEIEEVNKEIIANILKHSNNIEVLSFEWKFLGVYMNFVDLDIIFKMVDEPKIIKRNMTYDFFELQKITMGNRNNKLSKIDEFVKRFQVSISSQLDFDNKKRDHGDDDEYSIEDEDRFRHYDLDEATALTKMIIEEAIIDLNEEKQEWRLEQE